MIAYHDDADDKQSQKVTPRYKEKKKQVPNRERKINAKRRMRERKS